MPRRPLILLNRMVPKSKRIHDLRRGAFFGAARRHADGVTRHDAAE